VQNLVRVGVADAAEQARVGEGRDLPPESDQPAMPLQQVVMTVAPGGYGKTSLILCNALEMCTREGLIGAPPAEGPLRVAYWNAEDPEEEVERRIAAICVHYAIDPGRLRDQLFLGSKISDGRRLASLDRSGNVAFNDKLLAEATQFVVEQRIDCVMFDPLIAFHRAPEADNVAMEQVIKAFEQIAVTANCCVELAQHTRKQSQQSELTADDSRGAGAIVNAARSVRVLNRMTKEEAELPGIASEERRHYVRVARDKTNLAPPGKATWIHLVSVDLPNSDGTRPGDKVQTVEAWDYPQPFENVTPSDMRWAREEVGRKAYRTRPESPDWFGYALAKHLKLDIGLHGAPREPLQRGNRKRVTAIINTWVEKRVLAKEKRRDEGDRKDFEFFNPGSWDDEADVDC